jgi:4-amino-4-deoxy-L-arabinose transferase-like glycosyltransferase
MNINQLIKVSYTNDNIPLGNKNILYNSFFFILLTGYAIYVTSIIIHLPLQSYDESYNLLSSWEMQKSGDWIGITRYGILDHWDIKPPLFTWLTAYSYKVFGFSEWAGRLPSVLFGISTLILFYFFFISITKNYLLGIICALGIGLSIAFFGQHGITSGDYESVLTFFILLSFISIYKIFFEKSQRWMLLLAISLALGFMTKFVVGLIPIGFIIPAIIMNRGLGFKPNYKIIFLSSLIFCLIVIPYFVIRESMYHEKYLWLLFKETFFHKILGTFPDNQGAWNFYFIQMNNVFKEWSKLFYVALLVFLFLLVKSGRKKINHFKLSILSLIAVIIYLIIFTIPSFKANWYFHPVYPIMMIFTCVVLNEFSKKSFQSILYISLFIVLIYEGRNLVLHNNDKMNRDYEYMTKKLILPYKDLFKNKTVLSADDLIPSAITYTEILTNGKLSMDTTYEELNQHLLNRNDFDLLLVTDTSKTLYKDNLKLISAVGNMGLYIRGN